MSEEVPQTYSRRRRRPHRGRAEAPSAQVLPGAPESGAPATSVQGPRSMRTCVVCRTEARPKNLLHLTSDAGSLVIGRKGKGRGAHVCLSLKCLRGINAGLLSRVLDQTIDITPEAWLDLLKQTAAQRIHECIGLARRTGALDVGVDNILRAGEDAHGVLIASHDLAERSLRRVSRFGQVHVYSDSTTLGHAAGVGSLGALGIRAGQLAEQSAYWLRIWHEVSSHTEVTG